MLCIQTQNLPTSMKARLQKFFFAGAKDCRCSFGWMSKMIDLCVHGETGLVFTPEWIFW